MLSGLYSNPPNEGFISIFFRSMWGLPFANLEAKVSVTADGRDLLLLWAGQHLLVGGWATAPLVSKRRWPHFWARGSPVRSGPHARRQSRPFPVSTPAAPCGELQWVLAEACRWALRSGSGPGSFPSEPASLPGAAAVVRDGGVVCDGDHFQAPHGQALDGGLGGAENRRMAQCRK